MKFNLLAASLLVAGAMAANAQPIPANKLTAFDVRNVVEQSRQAAAAVRQGQPAVPLYKNTTLANIAADFDKLKAHHLNMLDIDQLTDLINAVAGQARFTQFEKVPVKFFKTATDIQALQRLSGAQTIEDFVAKFTPEQFKEFVAIADQFHGLSAASLTNIEATLTTAKKISDLKKYMSHVTIDFLNLILDPRPADAQGQIPQQARAIPALGKNIVKLLPDNVLNKIKFPLHEDDGEFLTDVQLENLKKGYQTDLKLNKVPAAKFAKYIKNEKALQRLVKENKVTDDQLNKLGAEGWNKIFADKEGCEKIPAGIKIRDVSNVKINAKCFARLQPDIQAAIVATHKKLDSDILSRVTQKMTNNWSYKNASGLEVLKFAENKSIIKQLGTHENVDSSAHPANGMDIDAVKEIKALYENLNAETIAAMNIDFPSELKDFKKHAEFYCGKEGVVSAVEDLFEEKADKKKEKEEEKKEGEQKAVIASNFWSTLTKEEAAKFFGPSYSVVTAEMSKESFKQLAANEVALAEVSSASIVQLKCFKELPKEIYAKLNEKAFAAVSAAQVESFRLADATDAQVPHISAEAKESFFAKVPAAVLAKNEARFGLFTAQQVAALPAATFKVAVNKTTMPKIKAEATKKITAEQLKTVPAEVLATITAEQVTMIGAEVADEKLSGLAVLLANQASLNSEARAALFARVPGSSASRFGVSAAVAAFAALALLA